jgi:hypothetical protein
MVTGSPAQQLVRSTFAEAVQHCKNPANRGGKKFQRCVGDYIKAKLAKEGHVPKKKRAKRAKKVAVTAI